MKLSLAELQQNLKIQFPQAMQNFELQRIEENYTVLKRFIHQADLRPGAIVSGPTLMQVTDFAAYIGILANQGGSVAAAFTTNLNINFLRQAQGNCAIIAQTKMLKVGKSLATAEVSLYSEGYPDLVAHAVVTFALTRIAPAQNVG